MIKAAVLTVSTTRKMSNDKSGDAVEKMLNENNISVIKREIVTDDKDKIKERLIEYADSLKADLVLTTGGTGLGPFDFTPSATKEIIDKDAPGISEYIRSEGARLTKRAILSAAVSGVRGETLIVNLPGSPSGAEQSLRAVIDMLPHAVNMINGGGH